MMLKDVTNVFSLTLQEEKQLEKCINTYSNDTSESKEPSRIKKVISSIFGKSEWQVAKNLLEEKSYTVIRKHFGDNESDKDLAPRVKVLAEFILRYLVTRASQTQLNIQSQYQVPRDNWIKDSMDQIEIDEILDRAIYGNGFTLPQASREIIHKLYKKESQTIKVEVDDFINYLKDDKDIQKIRKSHKSDQLNEVEIAVSEMQFHISSMDVFENKEYLLERSNVLSKFLQITRGHQKSVKILKNKVEILNSLVKQYRELEELQYDLLKKQNPSYNDSDYLVCK